MRRNLPEAPTASLQQTLRRLMEARLEHFGIFDISLTDLCSTLFFGEITRKRREFITNALHEFEKRGLCHQAAIAMRPENGIRTEWVTCKRIPKTESQN